MYRFYAQNNFLHQFIIKCFRQVIEENEAIWEKGNVQFEYYRKFKHKYTKNNFIFYIYLNIYLFMENVILGI